MIRSLHCFGGPVADIAARCRALVGASGEIAKVAFMPKEKADVERLFAETREFVDVPHVVCAMGSLGLPSRIHAARTHSLWTYASVCGLKALGHVSAQELAQLAEATGGKFYPARDAMAVDGVLKDIL